MTTFFVGPGGNNSNAGTSWALRRLTITSADTLLAAGDTLKIAPGTYREVITPGASGTAGNPITWIGDVTGQDTDGVGGVIRITGSDNDTTATRTDVLVITGRSYRTWRGLSFDTSTGIPITLTSNCTNNIFEDCIWNTQIATNNFGLTIAGTGGTHTIRRCLFYGMKNGGISFTHTSTVDNAGNAVENCIFFAMNNNSIETVRVGGITVKNCLFVGSQSAAVRVTTAITVGQTVTVNNCVIAGYSVGFQATVTGEIVENYNTIFSTGTPRTNVSTGANSDAFPAPLDFGRLLAGFNLIGRMFAHAAWSQVKTIAGTAESADDFFGKTRPTTSAKNSRGAIQYVDTNREVTTTRTGSVSLKLSDAGRHQMFVPVTAVSTVFSVYVQWEVDYAGTKPSLVIKQPGQSDTTVTATGSSGSWEQLTTTLTPAASPPYVIAELVSSNTASATNYDVFFDDFTVS